jgi:hypothetical protein
MGHVTIATHPARAATTARDPACPARGAASSTRSTRSTRPDRPARERAPLGRGAATSFATIAPQLLNVALCDSSASGREQAREHRYESRALPLTTMEHANPGGARFIPQDPTAVLSENPDTYLISNSLSLSGCRLLALRLGPDGPINTTAPRCARHSMLKVAVVTFTVPLLF